VSRLTPALKETFVTLETPKVAKSLEALGTVFVLQLLAVFQLPVPGLDNQVWARPPTVSDNITTTAQTKE
jgi:hypothetical protein